jgi:hypothetical protein
MEDSEGDGKHVTGHGIVPAAADAIEMDPENKASTVMVADGSSDQFLGKVNKVRALFSAG